MRMQDKVALVTGGAFGMGEAMVRLLAREGAKVVIGDILDTEGAAVAASIVADGGDAMFVHLDVSDESGWIAALAAVVARHGRLDVLVNNAGISGSVPELLDTGLFDRLMAVNARGTFLGLKHGVLQMQRNGGGAIVNLSSMSGLVGQAVIHMGYNASKAAVHLMTKSAAVQFAQDGIRVNSVHPGLMPPMRTSKSTADPAVRERLLANVPMRRSGRADEVAYAVLFLASDEASYITGAELIVDGGFTAL